ncbi:hypothetical protein F5148DRAFT_328621 [Russula earlei]|uniref:Uncharacterized protein n=1 Tax=Russula earlei TaxID=71964 RepID=A0ACC0UIL6_9AGAM|nr:hypothetical protein F5148DRAFT_328621 [Russula earlei]
MVPPSPSNDATLAMTRTMYGNTSRLTSSQRSRLVKSTRKVAQILGENPIPIVNPPLSILRRRVKKAPGGNAVAHSSPLISITKKITRAALEPLKTVHRRDLDANNDGMRSSQSPPADGDASHGRDWLVTQAESEFDSEHKTHSPDVSSPGSSRFATTLRKRRSSLISTSSSSSSSSSSTQSFIPSLSEWDKGKEDFEAIRRRKRLAKLAHHLGEGVPPELVLPNSGITKPKRRDSRRRFRRSAPAFRVPPDLRLLPVESPTSDEGTLGSASPLLSPSDVQRPAIKKTVEVFQSSGHTLVGADATSPPSLVDQRHLRARSEYSIALLRERRAAPLHPNRYSEENERVGAISLDDGQGQEPETGAQAFSQPRSESRMAFLRPRSTASTPEPVVVVRRSERRQGWSGEWNAESMRVVISKLRDLR